MRARAIAVQGVSVSQQNRKLGLIPSVSLFPGRDCGECGHCVSQCYAVKMTRHYPSAGRSWDRNSKLLKLDPAAFFRAIDAYLNAFRPRYFRVHVAGDFVDQKAVAAWFRIARAHPDTAFLAFTGRFDLRFNWRPKNFQIIYSIWPDGPKNTPKKARKAFVGEENLSGAFECPDGCDTCGHCFRDGGDVFFKQH